MPEPAEQEDESPDPVIEPEVVTSYITSVTDAKAILIHYGFVLSIILIGCLLYLAKADAKDVTISLTSGALGFLTGNPPQKTPND